MFGNKLSWGSVEVEIISADIPSLLSSCAANGISILRLYQTDPLTVRIWIAQKEFELLRRLSEKSGASLHVRNRYGISRFLKKIGNRPVFLSGILILLAASLWIPERVLFIQVEGNTHLATARILEAADSCGIVFGASRRSVRSERMKNTLLEKMPQLQWAGINTKGCTAVISVREREADTKRPAPGAVVSLVASRDGIVQSGTATAGSLLCKPGQAVQAGDVLISGYTDCGISIRAQKAAGEIFALTVRSVSVAAPLKYVPKGEEVREIKKYSLLIGKKHIFFSKDSGIFYATCDKIRKEYTLTLPGGFALPVSILVETLTVRDALEAQADGVIAESLSMNTAQDYLHTRMISGSILDSDVYEEITDSLYRLHGNFLCSEMIARERSEEIMEEYGKNSG